MGPPSHSPWPDDDNDADGGLGEEVPPAVPTSMRAGGQGAVSPHRLLNPFQDWGFGGRSGETPAVKTFSSRREREPPFESQKVGVSVSRCLKILKIPVIIRGLLGKEARHRRDSEMAGVSPPAPDPLLGRPLPQGQGLPASAVVSPTYCTRRLLLMYGNPLPLVRCFLCDLGYAPSDAVRT